MRNKNSIQANLFDVNPIPPDLERKVGRLLGDKGMKQAMKSADNETPGWSKKAYQLFKKWLEEKSTGHIFMIEDFRREVNGLETPPSNRAFGGMAVKARHQRLIVSVGLGTVSNKNAHGCYAGRWRKI